MSNSLIAFAAVMLAALAVPAARRHLTACFQIDPALVTVALGLRTALGMVGVLLVARAYGRLDLGVPLSLGILFGNLGDFGDPYAIRARTMLYTTLACAAFTVVGGLVSAVWYLHLPVAICAAALVGYAGALGPASGLVGVFCLALFSFYAGSAISPGVALLDGACLVLGGVAAMGVTLTAAPFRRFQPTRRKLALAYRQLGEVCTHPAERWSDTGIATAVLAADRSVRLCGAAGETAAWLKTLLAGAERARALVFALSALPPDTQVPPSHGPLFAATGDLSKAIGGALLRKRDVPQLAPLLARFKAASERCEDPASCQLAAQLCEALGDAVTALGQDWPVGRPARTESVVVERVGLRASLRAHLHAGDRNLRHAVQMALVFGIATAVSLGPWDTHLAHHAYWIPLTVAWIFKPEAGGTVSKLGMRIWGTLIGVLVAALSLHLVHEPLGIAALLGVGAFLTIAFLSANYSITVIGVTILVLCLAGLAGAATEPLAVARMWATLIGSGLAMVVALTYSLRIGATVPAQLARLCESLRQFTVALTAGEDRAAMTRRRAAVLQARVAATNALLAAETEPRSYGAAQATQLDLPAARALLVSLQRASAQLLLVDILGERQQMPAAAWQAIEASLRALEQRLHALTLTTTEQHDAP